MLCLGFSGGLNRVYENPFDLPGAFSHDGAAAIVADGVVLAAIEEERLNRIKHSNKFPTEAIKFCLREAGARLEDVDRIAFYASEPYCNTLLNRVYLAHPDMPARPDARAVMRRLLRLELGSDIADERIFFAPHHTAHAVSAFAMSGFEQSLILAIDGYGDFLSGIVARGDGEGIVELDRFPQRDSLGLFYLEVIQFAGYGPFDEYKAMGLAPYGHADPYRALLAQCYELLPEGRYRLDLDRIAPTLLEAVPVRKKGQPFTAAHENLCMALQEALERIVFHVLEHWRASLGLRHLCLAGGVAHNCTMNGKLLASGRFDDVFVQPAAHDAGCALGAALIGSSLLGRPAPRRRLTHVYWGRDTGDEAAIERELAAWEPFVAFKPSAQVSEDAAALIAGGAVIGWMQGRSEFGPRALGNRSILADPRPAGNKERINAMVKKRESYRPFAPVVLEEALHDYFDVPPGQSAFPFMIFVVHVRPDKRELLGAVTHVDGSARLQTVNREANAPYWDLIDAFGRLTGVPVLLNTSFNNNAEPIVDSVEDAVATFLTTGLDYLVVGPFVAEKRTVGVDDWLRLSVSLPPYVRLHETRAFVDSGRLEVTHDIRANFSARVRSSVSKEAFDVLMQADAGGAALADLLARAGVATERWAPLVGEIRDLWAQRLVRIRPAAVAEPRDRAPGAVASTGVASA